MVGQGKGVSEDVQIKFGREDFWKDMINLIFGFEYCVPLVFLYYVYAIFFGNLKNYLKRGRNNS